MYTLHEIVKQANSVEWLVTRTELDTLQESFEYTTVWKFIQTREKSTGTPMSRHVRPPCSGGFGGGYRGCRDERGGFRDGDRGGFSGTAWLTDHCSLSMLTTLHDQGFV